MPRGPLTKRRTAFGAVYTRPVDCVRNAPSFPAGGSSNGRTADSDSASLGSNPSPPATCFPYVFPFIALDKSVQLGAQLGKSVPDASSKRAIASSASSALRDT